MHTLGPVLLVNRDQPKGTIEMGNAADLAWLDRDPITTSDTDLLHTEVLGTWIAGQRVWPEAEAEAE
jgi:predicted amidohydrolase YtcJ